MYRLLRPVLFRLGAERAHHLTLATARLAQNMGSWTTEPFFSYEHATLYQRLWGLDFPNPVGLAAGFDKNAQLVPFWKRLGFGFAEVGSVSARPSEGNPRPRTFRLAEDRALVNRMGLNNEGAERVAQRLEDLPSHAPFSLGINLAKTHAPEIMGPAAIEDFRESFHLLAPLADYVALNISCPNTREGKTFEAPDALNELLEAVFAERNALKLSVPILVKFSPPATANVAFDSRIEELVEVALEHGIAGFIATNTASDRKDLTTSASTLEALGDGGLSGAPLAERSTALVCYLYRLTDGAVPIIGVGGVDSPEAAYEKIRAGASLVQLYTGLVYEGPGLVKRIKEGLVALMEEDGLASISEAVGADA